MSNGARSKNPHGRARALVRLFRIPESIIEAAERSVEQRRRGDPVEPFPKGKPRGSAKVREDFAAADFSPLSEL